MRHISNLIDLEKVKNCENEGPYSAPEEILDEQTADIVNLLFRELQAIFPTFRQAWTTQEELVRIKKNWMKAFVAANINNIEQLQKGLTKCRLSPTPFVPTCGQFIAWCAPMAQDLGLPALEEAYDMSILINRQFSDYRPSCPKTYTVVRHAINQIGPSEYRSMRAEVAYKTFQRYYAIACEQFLAGKLTEIPKALPQETKYRPEDWHRSNQARLIALKLIRNAGLPIKIIEEPSSFIKPESNE